MNEFNLYEREIETRNRSERLLEGAVWPRVRRSGSWPGYPVGARRRTARGLHRLADAIDT
jgi:hypothetical protein